MLIVHTCICLRLLYLTVTIGFKIHYIWCNNVHRDRRDGAYFTVSRPCLVALLPRAAFYVQPPRGR
jgi:hypothetical protein